MPTSFAPGSPRADFTPRTRVAPAPAPELPDFDTPMTEPPARESPVREAPAREAKAPVREAPVREAAAREAPAREAPAREAPVREASVRLAPTREAPAREAPVREAPAREAPVHEAPIRETPAREAPARGAPVCEQPAREAPRSVPKPPPAPPPPAAPAAKPSTAKRAPPPPPANGANGAMNGKRSTPSGSSAVAKPPGMDDEQHSDYSDVGEYSDDHDFFDPADGALSEDGPEPRYDSDADDEDDEEENEVVEKEEEEVPEGRTGAPGEVPVRQNSNFSRLSAQSWLTVDSAEDLDVNENAAENSPLIQKGAQAEAEATMATQIGDPDEEDYNPLADPRPDAHRLLASVRGKRLADKSVFECATELLSGMPAYKKKSFRRVGARRVWLSADCAHLCWTSKKDDMDSDSIKLQRVAKLKCVDREVAVDVVEGYRIALLFATSDEAGLWARCLSCLIPLQAKVRAPHSFLLREKDREDFTLEDDSFNGVALRDHFSVNSYAVIGPVKGHSGQARLAFSRSEKIFVAIRYVPLRLTPLLLRSYEEIAVLKRLQHRNIIRYSECLLYQNRGGSFLVFEHQPRGMIMDASKLEGVSPIPERAARELIRDVIAALEYLHALQIAHADVRPDNLLRAVNGSVKLNPLGCITHEFTEVRSMSALVQARLAGASPAFLAPELCWIATSPQLPPKSYAMDVWAIGAVLYFMLYGRVPFGGKDNNAIMRNICEGKLRFPRQPETSRKVRNLLKGVLGEKDPRTRIPLNELKMHPWFVEGSPTAVGPGAPDAFGTAPLVVAPEEVDVAVQVAKVRIPC